MDIRKVKKLIELLEESAVSELEIKEGEESVRISRHATTSVAPSPTPTPVQVVTPTHSTAMPENPTPAIPPTDKTIVSPMVGTFYRASSPTAVPFVAIGQSIKIGDVIGIIEAMKMFNQIEADKNGVISTILPQDGEPVEYNQPLITLK